MVFCNGVIPTDWQESFILNFYKGKGDALEWGNYHSLKLTDQVMKLLKCVLDSFIQEMVDIDAMQFGFVPVVASLMPSSSSADCKRSTSLQTSHFTWPLLTWRRFSTEYPGKFFGGP